MVLNNINKNDSILLEVFASVFTVSSNFTDNPRIWGLLEDVTGQTGDADSSRAPCLTPGSWTESGVLECPSQFTTVTTRRWCFSFFMWYIHNFFIYFSESLWIEYTVSRTDVTCDMWPSSDQSDLWHSEISIYYIRTGIGFTRAPFYVLPF